jgi:hypothetical protein
MRYAEENHAKQVVLPSPIPTPSDIRNQYVPLRRTKYIPDKIPFKDWAKEKDRAYHCQARYLKTTLKDLYMARAFEVSLYLAGLSSTPDRLKWVSCRPYGTEERMINFHALLKSALVVRI